MPEEQELTDSQEQPEDTSADDSVNTDKSTADESPDEADSSVEDNQEKALAEAADDNSTGKHILVVEDTKLLRSMLVKIISEMGHVVEEADNGVYGLAMVKRAKASAWEYDLILTDLMMPEMDGWALIKQLRERNFFPRIPVIVLTANAGRDSVIKCARMGISHYIVKPFQAARVMETVNKALKIMPKSDSSDDVEPAENDETDEAKDVSTDQQEDNQAEDKEQQESDELKEKPDNSTSEES